MLIKNIKTKIKKIKAIRNLYFLFQPMKEYSLFKLFMIIKQYIWFFKTFFDFRKKAINTKFNSFEFYPCLFDKLDFTPVDPVYFYQDTWAARKIFETKPQHHYDVGSSVRTMAIISQFMPVTFIDIRPVELKLPNFSCIRASILKLPFEDNSIESLSSLCVVEHIGLGRYGDPIDPYGSEKAIKELKRVLKIEGVLLISVPVDSENKVYFNAHRAFTREYLLELFEGFQLLEEKYIYGNQMYDEYDKSKGFGTGLYCLKKVRE